MIGNTTKPYIKDITSMDKYIVEIIAPNNNMTDHKLCFKRANDNLYSVICSIQ